jgi:hypothetical protein
MEEHLRSSSTSKAGKSPDRLCEVKPRKVYKSSYNVIVHKNVQITLENVSESFYLKIE